MRLGLALISVSATMWIAVFVLMLLEDYRNGARSLSQNVSPTAFGAINILLCAGGLGCSGIWRNSAQGTAGVRKAIGIVVAFSCSCGCLCWPARIKLVVRSKFYSLMV